VDADGFDDFLVGAPDNDGAAAGAGKVYLYLNPPSGTVSATVADAFFRGGAAGDLFGYDVAIGGDINNDGYDDLIIGAPGNDDAGAAFGKVYFYWGGALSGTYSATAADESVTGTYADDQLGQVVAAAGDLNQDGYDDVLMAGPSASDHVSTGGKIAFVHGPITNRIPMWWYGLASNDKAGVGLSAVEDSDLDGYPELAIGCSGCGLSHFGEVYIRKGAAENR
ncbi:MAG TPA: integrin alpha, partial [Myxococcota bacterium]|nr:integrin alpha [Myxococcota bacterium]